MSSPLFPIRSSGHLLLENGPEGLAAPATWTGSRTVELVSPEGRVRACAAGETATPATLGEYSLESLQALSEAPGKLSPPLLAALPVLVANAHRLPYLDLADHHYIYPFRPEGERNRDIYRSDAKARDIYQSAICDLVKRARRTKERTAAEPVELDFGAVRYVLPSHFGFCLGVQNAIERAYEALSENKNRRVFMLSDLIHNPTVNRDLTERGLLYLQSDKGKALANPATGRLWWDEVNADDVVVLPAFGATLADKAKLVSRGVDVRTYDATCMLVEKVWKTARRLSLDGFTIIVHGKSEHEETKTTFSHAAHTGPALVIRDMAEAERLFEIIRETDAATKRELLARYFSGKHTPGFDPSVHLERLAVVNQTTLLRNETLEIMKGLEAVLAKKFGTETLSDHFSSQKDTLCYATQVNQEALARALEAGPDYALVVGGSNSSNTWQLFRLCEARLGGRVHYVQDDRDLLSVGEVVHHPYRGLAHGGAVGEAVSRPFLSGEETGPVRILISTGASCPDGLVERIIMKINGFFPPETVRSVSEVLAGLDGGRGV